MLHGADISELAFGFKAGGIGPQPATNQVVGLGFEVEAQLVLDVGGGISAKQPSIASPKGNAFHAGSSGECRRFALSTLATAVV